MDLKKRMIAEWTTEQHTVTELSRKYSISRPTVYKWIKRFKADSFPGLEDQSRRPLRSPRQTDEKIIQLIVKEKLKNRHRGRRKIWHQLKRQKLSITIPAPSTLGEWLKKRGLVMPRVKLSRVPPYRQPFKQCLKPNTVWSVDYKGQFHTRNGAECYPVTISDYYSRYLLACQVLPGPQYGPTKDVFKQVFQEYGLPNAIRSDNGVPFASTNVTGLSSLSLWFVQLGIIPERIEKGCPEQNGRHERMHRTLKEETACPPGATIKEQQKRSDLFRRDYNYDRPYEALGQEA
jgi:transposase InsO family protein